MAITKASKSNEINLREKTNRRLAREVATEGIVLLENDGTLPIIPCRIALYGAGAATTIKGGTGSGEVNSRDTISIEMGLKNAGFEITTNTWLREYEVLMKEQKHLHNKKTIKKLFTASADDRINIMADGFVYPVGRQITESDIKESNTDTCIYVIARQVGECSDRSLEKYEYNLFPDEIENIKKVALSYKKTIIVINIGAPFDTTELESIEGLNSLIFFCQQGSEGGNALADILTGDVTPSGCLSSTWAKKYTDLPYAMEYSYLKVKDLNEIYREGIYVGYRYFDSFLVKPRYCFGYGLSYAEFEIEYIDTIINKTTVVVTANVINISELFSGKRTVMLFVSAPDGRLVREYQSLVSFIKTDKLEPNQSQEVNLIFDITDIAGFDTDTASFILEKGDYILRLGVNAEETNIVAVLNLDEDAITEVCENLCKPDRIFDEIKPLNIRPKEFPEDTPIFEIYSDDIIPIKHNYELTSQSVSEITKELVKRLTLGEMIKLLFGTGMFPKPPHFTTPGAAAHTTSDLISKGIPNVSLCDGPAGLRLYKTSVKYKNGKIKPIDPPIEILDALPWLAKKFIFGNPKKGELLYQFATAFPVGTALAQTWNTELIEEVGRAIGEEMIEYGVTYWLAPGMNIHRNPLCGRNFEYFSEDPILSGKMAVSLTMGVQSYEGLYVTIKHFAANNQELNRNRSNSCISERTLREIYLKGFKIAVIGGGAKAVMTSYNLINGVYAPNNNDLCTKILRCEWGFDGIIMTDWFATGKGLASNALCIKAGNDMIMPGGKSAIKDFMKEFKKGLVTEAEIKTSCERIVEALINSRKMG